jgi:hypothetical protein
MKAKGSVICYRSMRLRPARRPHSVIGSPLRAREMCSCNYAEEKQILGDPLVRRAKVRSHSVIALGQRQRASNRLGAHKPFGADLLFLTPE